MNAPSILILCTGNSCRSQMAEGYLRALAGERFRVYSAGMTPKDRVHPLAVEVMAEDGVDISAQHPKDLSEFLGRMSVSYLIIVCSRADESCPSVFPGMGQRLYWPFDDPDAYTGDDPRVEFRRVRDEIKARISAWQAEL
ncbi:MAG: arsenate reductase ArsC [Planctomycetaceae bacterium]|nr:arsenate reductase ArsC [Planctomycetaceae bacterium]